MITGSIKQLISRAKKRKKEKNPGLRQSTLQSKKKELFSGISRTDVMNCCFKESSWQ